MLGNIQAQATRQKHSNDRERLTDGNGGQFMRGLAKRLSRPRQYYGPHSGHSALLTITVITRPALQNLRVLNIDNLQGSAQLLALPKPEIAMLVSTIHRISGI